MIPSSFLLALTLVAQVPASAAGPFHSTIIRPDGGPEVLAQGLDGPLVSLRLSAPVDPALPEGTVELLQELAGPAAREAAARFGARLSFRHEDGRALISVTGPVAAFDALASLLRVAATELDLSAATLRRARARAEDRVLAGLEQPGPRVRRVLWHELFGGPPPTGPAATRLSPEDIRRAGGLLYDRARLRVTVVGNVPEPVLRAAFSRWPAPPAGASVPTPSSDGADAARPQAHREWAGLGYRVEADPPVVAITAELIGRRIRRSSLREGAARAWRGPDAWALVVTGATEPGDPVVRATAGVGSLPVRGAGPGESATGVGIYLRRTIAEALALLGPISVREVRTEVRRRLLLEARTVSGRAEVIGRLADALGPEGAAAFLESLEAVELEAVRELLQQLLGAPAIYVEAR